MRPADRVLVLRPGRGSAIRPAIGAGLAPRMRGLVGHLPARLNGAAGAGAGRDPRPTDSAPLPAGVRRVAARPSPSPTVEPLRPVWPSATGAARPAQARVYRRAGGAGTAAETTDGVIGRSGPGGIAAGLDQRILGLVREGVEQWGKRHLSPQRIADEAYRTLVKQIARERERNGR
jgi:hypothetical protein